ncbi:GGDEF domain-containing protein [Poseidonibacter lekithochrous]|uniref:GGDEF domain-containing protein n=1 Tax=Poseidonibacter TaxID=2321187 RepID=UPI001C08A14D|nr:MULTISPECIES: GGDEF domain-containing protein [Poseidonibacter]MBU3014916.1 GGDEF domain-containing protein [Poseidonibacter lekithochrous]MDO6828214.1 GGDEF domain-containing protein [Poseidonibacter sp. 1_MG-2023]
MNPTCENIIKINEELKLLNKLEDIYLTIFKRLKAEYNISELEILLKTIDKTESLFKSSEIIYDDFLNSLKYIENESTQIYFLVYSKTKENNDLIIKELPKLKLALEFYSSSLYNKYLENSIHELSIVDSITGAFNRSYLDVYVDNILSISNREQKKVGFLKVGVDQFKAVIDEFDYTIGDKVLIELTSTLKESVRISDIVIKMSEDEFLVILLNVINENNATIVTDKLINNFSQRKVLIDEDTKQTLKKTICVGMSIFPDDATNIDDAIKKADIALYEARNIGRSKLYKYSEESVNAIDFF